MSGPRWTRKPKGAAGKSGGKSRGKSPLFGPGGAQGPGRGPKKGAPNAGRPPSRIREAMRLALDEQARVLVDIASGKPVVRVKLPNSQETETFTSDSPGDRIRAIEMLTKYGLGTQMEMPVDGNGEAVGAQVIVIGGREVRF